MHDEPNTATRDRKRAAILDYDAWVERDLGPGPRQPMLKIAIGLAVAATVTIAVVRMWGADSPPADKGVIELAGDAEELATRLRALPLEQHVRLVQVGQRALEDRLLVGPAKWASRLDATQFGNGGIARILNRGQSGLVSLRGGGAYFSFTSRSNSYDDGPDIELQRWAFHSGFAGGDVGVVVRLDQKSVDDVTLDVLPDVLRLRSAAAFDQAVRKMRAPSPAAVVGGVYAVRSVRWGKSDVIATFEVLDRGPYGVSFVWYELETRPTPRRR